VLSDYRDPRRPMSRVFGEPKPNLRPPGHLVVPDPAGAPIDALSLSQKLQRSSGSRAPFNSRAADIEWLQDVSAALSGPKAGTAARRNIQYSVSKLTAPYTRLLFSAESLNRTVGEIDREVVRLQSAGARSLYAFSSSSPACAPDLWAEAIAWCTGRLVNEVTPLVNQLFGLNCGSQALKEALGINVHGPATPEAWHQLANAAFTGLPVRRIAGKAKRQSDDDRSGGSKKGRGDGASIGAAEPAARHVQLVEPVVDPKKASASKVVSVVASIRANGVVADMIADGRSSLSDLHESVADALRATGEDVVATGHVTNASLTIAFAELIDEGKRDARCLPPRPGRGDIPLVSLIQNPDPAARIASHTLVRQEMRHSGRSLGFEISTRLAQKVDWYDFDESKRQHIGDLLQRALKRVAEQCRSVPFGSNEWYRAVGRACSAIESDAHDALGVVSIMPSAVLREQQDDEPGRETMPVRIVVRCDRRVGHYELKSRGRRLGLSVVQRDGERLLRLCEIAHFEQTSAFVMNLKVDRRADTVYVLARTVSGVDIRKTEGGVLSAALMAEREVIAHSRAPSQGASQFSDGVEQLIEEAVDNSAGDAAVDAGGGESFHVKLKARERMDAKAAKRMARGAVGLAMQLLFTARKGLDRKTKALEKYIISVQRNRKELLGSMSNSEMSLRRTSYRHTRQHVAEATQRAMAVLRAVGRMTRRNLNFVAATNLISPCPGDVDNMLVIMRTQGVQVSCDAHGRVTMITHPSAVAAVELPIHMMRTEITESAAEPETEFGTEKLRDEIRRRAAQIDADEERLMSLMRYASYKKEVELRIPGDQTHFTAVFDTGASISTLSMELAARLREEGVLGRQAFRALCHSANGSAGSGVHACGVEIRLNDRSAPLGLVVVSNLKGADLLISPLLMEKLGVAVSFPMRNDPWRTGNLEERAGTPHPGASCDRS